MLGKGRKDAGEQVGIPAPQHRTMAELHQTFARCESQKAGGTSIPTQPQFPLPDRETQLTSLHWSMASVAKAPPIPMGWGTVAILKHQLVGNTGHICTRLCVLFQISLGKRLHYQRGQLGAGVRHVQKKSNASKLQLPSTEQEHKPLISALQKPPRTGGKRSSKVASRIGHRASQMVRAVPGGQAAKLCAAREGCSSVGLGAGEKVPLGCGQQVTLWG